jgi:hypothetical protein
MNPIVVTIAHRHGSAEATRRIKAEIESARTRYEGKLKIAEENWNGNHLVFRVAALGQPVTGKIDIGNDHVRAEVLLTWLMEHLTEPAEALIKAEGQRALHESA